MTATPAPAPMFPTSRPDDDPDPLARIIAACRERNSRLGYFAAVYRKVVTAVEQGVARGDFDDPDAMRAVNHTFLQRYVEAFDAHERRAPVSGCWGAAFDAAADRRVSVVQHLLLGVNAHINFDLPIAVNDAIAPDALPGFADDYARMNKLLASVVAEVSADTARFAPLLYWLTRVGGQADDVILDFSMQRAREHAWRCALELPLVTGEARADLIATFDRRATEIAHAVAQPTGVVRIAAFLIRRTDRGTVAEIIAELLD